MTQPPAIAVPEAAGWLRETAITMLRTAFELEAAHGLHADLPPAEQPAWRHMIEACMDVHRAKAAWNRALERQAAIDAKDKL